MAQDAELKLKVSLDLAFFRQQISTISTQLAGQGVQLNVQFNKKSIADQYRLLDRYLRGKKYTVELNLAGGLTKNEFEKIKGRLDDLRDLRKVEIPIGIKNGATGKDVDKVVASIKERLAQNQQIKQGGGKLRIETSIKPSITNQDIADLKKAAKDKLSKIGALEIATKLETPKAEDLLKALQKNLNRQKPLLVKTSIRPSILRADVRAFKKAVEEKLSGITVKVKAELEGISKQPFSAGPTGLAGLQEYMRSQGMGPTGGAEAKRRAMFEDVVTGATFKELQRMTQQANITGRSGLKTKAQMQEALLQINDAAMEGILGNLQMRMKDPLPIKRGFLDQIARAVFWMAGVDPEYLRQQASQRRALPGINFPATIPSRAVSIGPSATGRALPASRAAAGMIGAAQAPVGLLPSITRRSSIQAGIENIFAAGGPRFPEGASGKLALSTEALQARVNAQLAEYFKVVEAKVLEVFNPQDLKRALNIFSYLPQALRDAEARTRQARVGIPSARGIAGLLPAAQGRAPSTYSTGAIGGESREQMMARRTAEAYARSALRGMDVMGGGAGRPPSPYSYAYRSARPTSAIVPYAAGGAMVPVPSMAGGGGAVPPSGGGGGRGGMGGFGGFGRAMGGVNLPGAGTIRELGSEFAFATKQVLLFGQAYKLLAFAQDFPAQVSAAVSQLQSFRNTLLSVTGSAGAAADANEFILAAVEKYSIPLQSARDGFTKLFASMEPAGFAAGEIQNLFLGISKAAATYGMSADKVDRVNYAFAQMASKGQVMSEELKGQLGDVLPGAMGIFAKAAGFEGPDAIQKFGKALEDGEYKGGKMRELLRNVANEMNKEFGPGAEGAARTFQGAINRMQTATAKLYESFEPAAIGVMNAVMVPFVQTLKNATDGINAYFSGQEAATPAARGFADILKTLVPTLAGIGENLKYVFQQVAVLIQGFGAFALQVGRLLALPIVRYLAGTYVQTLLLTTAFKALATSGLGAALVAIAQFIARGVVYAQVTLGMRVATQQTTVAMYQFGTAVQTVMIKSVIGIALVAISAFIARIVELRGQLAAISGDAKSMEDLAKSSAKLGDIGATKEAVGNIKDRLETYKQLKEEIQAAKKAEGLRGEGATAGMTQDIKLTTKLGDKLVELGLINKRVLQTSSNGYKANELALDGVLTKVNENISSFDKAGQKGSQYIEQAIKQNKKLQEQGTVGVETPDEKSQKAAEKAAEEARKLADDKRKYEGDLMKLSSAQAISLNEMEFDHWKNLQQAKYDFLEAGQNEWMSREIKFQRDLQAIEIRRIEAIRRARIDTVKAETEAQASAYVAGSGGGITGLMQGSTGISSGPHFDVRRADGSHITETEARALFDPSVRRQLQMTSGYGRRVPPVPGASSFHAGIDLAGPANTPLNLAPGYSMQSAGIEGGLGYTANVRGPQGQMYKVGHLQQPQAGMPASRVRSEAKKDYASALASQEAINAKERENAQIKYANIQAQQELNILIREYTASIVPVEQQKLENNLLQNRISLISSGVFGEALDTEQKISEAREEAALGTQMANAQIEQNNKLVKDGIISQEQADKLNASQVEKIKQLTQGLEAYIPLLRERLKLEQSSAEATLRGEIARATPLGGMGLSAGFIGPAAAKFEEAIGRGATTDEASRFAELQNQLTLLETRNEAIKQSIYGIGNAFGEAMTTGVASLVSGTATAKEVFASFLQSVGQALSQAASQMIATYIAIGIAKIFAGLGGGGGGADMSKSGITEKTLAPMRQYSMEGPLTGAIGFAGANGGVVQGGFQAFANGGVVSGPTLGLIGEGKYNEAVVPLPDGKSIPVQMRGGQSSRDLLSSGTQSQSSPSVLSMSFQSTNINGVEYVSRDQLEAAMMETRKIAARDGANRGASLALDRLQNSPNARRRIGI